jgi:YbgC/YbaW family acyl-CoA thioester hydrolase
MIEFEYPLLIQESHLDTFGHINNATYLSLYEEARWDIITKRGFGLKEIKERKMGPVLLEVNLKFKKEIKNREKITIKSRCVATKHPLIMGFEQEMILANGDIASTVEMTVGLMDTVQRKLIKPTEEWLFAVGLKG